MSASGRAGRGHVTKYERSARPSAPPRRTGTRPSRIDDVVEAAILLFGERGVERVTIEEIAAEAGLVPRAVYYHFATKDDLVNAAFARVRHEVDAIVTESTDIESAVRETFAWGRAHPQRAQLLWVHSVGATPAMSDLWQEFIADHVNATQRYRTPGSSAHRQLKADATNQIAARTAVIAGTLVQLYWGAGELASGYSSEEVATAVATMFRKLIRG
jgi:AcrR family transcriptional regulator